MIGIATRRPMAFTLALGLMGGAALVATAWNTSRGPMVLLPYGALMIATAAYLRLERVPGFVRRFGLALGTFMVATLILYLSIGALAAKSLFLLPASEHAWRLALMLAIGGAFSLAVAQLTATQEFRQR